MYLLPGDPARGPKRVGNFWPSNDGENGDALLGFEVYFIFKSMSVAHVLVLWVIELDDGIIYRKPLYLMVETMVSCRFSLKPNPLDGFMGAFSCPWRGVMVRES